MLGRHDDQRRVQQPLVNPALPRTTRRPPVGEISASAFTAWSSQLAEQQDGHDQTINRDTFGQTHVDQGTAEHLGFFGDHGQGRGADRAKIGKFAAVGDGTGAGEDAGTGADVSASTARRQGYRAGSPWQTRRVRLSPSTSNAHHPTNEPNGGHWMLVVECWLLNVSFLR